MANIAFFGTPEFAIPSLEATYAFCNANSHHLKLVVTQPDRPKGRGKHHQPTPIKALAEKLNIRVLTPETLRKHTPDGDEFFDAFLKAHIDLAIIVAYGHIITPRLLALPKRGFVNVHASILPRWRGAAPIHRAILTGDIETGVSIMDLVKELDAGDVYQIERLKIKNDDNTENLTFELANLGANALTACLPQILEGTMPKVPQPQEGITYAHMIKKEEGLIDFSQKAQAIQNQVRAMHPWPSAYAYHKGKLLKLLPPCEVVLAEPSEKTTPGTITQLGSHLDVQCADHALRFLTVQLEGKRRMLVNELCNGYNIALGDSLQKI